jgi:hypothetical protein
MAQEALKKVLVPFVRYEVRHLGRSQADLADLGGIRLGPGVSVLRKRPLTTTVGRESPMTPVKALGIGDMQLAAVTEKSQAANQARRALHSSIAFRDIPGSIARATPC